MRRFERKRYHLLHLTRAQKCIVASSWICGACNIWIWFKPCCFLNNPSLFFSLRNHSSLNASVLKDESRPGFHLHFVDDNQAAAVEWLKFIGKGCPDGFMSRKCQ